MIQTEHLTKKFNTFTALNDVSCKIQNGSIYGMVGSNGAKTYLRCISSRFRQHTD